MSTLFRTGQRSRITFHASGILGVDTWWILVYDIYQD